MLALFLCLLVSTVLCELPPAGYPQYRARAPSSVANWPTPAGYSSNDIDAVFQRFDGRLYTFKGDVFWRFYDRRFQIPNFVQPEVVAESIKETFGIDGPIDGAFVRSNSKLYIFKGDRYWRYTDLNIARGDDVPVDQFVLDDDYPKKIIRNFIGVETPIDDVFELPNGHIYFFRNDSYYRIRDKYLTDLVDVDEVDSCYPKKITNEWQGITTPVRAAFRRTSDRQIYFFSSTTYYSNWDKYIQHSFLDRFPEGPIEPEPILYCVSQNPVPASDAVPLSGDIAMFQRKNGKIYVFESATDRYWRLTDYHYTPHIGDCLDAGYPKSISAMWVGAPSQINAVFQRNNGRIYFFMPNNTYVRFSDKYFQPEEDPVTVDYVDAGYNPPLDLTHFGFRPDELENREIIGAFQRANTKIYIFMQSLIEPFHTYYYRVSDKYSLTNEDNDSVDPGYGDTLLSDGFEGVPEDFDTVFQRVESDRKIYFMKDGMAYIGRDKYLFRPTPCTACQKTAHSED